MERYENLVREELLSPRYDFAPSSEQVVAAVRRKHRRHLATTATAVVIGLSITGVGVGIALAHQGSATPGPVPAASQPVQDARVSGVPANLQRVFPVDVAGVALPATGERVYYQGNGSTLVVVISPAEMPGLPDGKNLDIPWAVGPGSPKFTLYSTANATYLIAFPTSGENWFMVMTGGDEAARVAAIGSVVSASVK